MNKILTDPLSHIQKLITTHKERILIGFSGAPGSGKTTYTRNLVSRLPADMADRIMVLGMDGFHLTKKQLREFPDPDAAFARRGAPWTFAPKAMAENMQLLKASYKANIVTWPGYEHGVGDPSEAAYSIAPEVQLIIIEGLYLALNTKGWDQVSVLCDETWYLDVSINTAMNRIIPRHMSSWGMTLEEAARKVAANDRLNAELVFTTRDQADWLIKPLEILL